MSDQTKDLTASNSTLPTAAEINDYLANLPASVAGNGRLIFGLDATGSRQDTWDTATAMQADMFKAAPSGLDVQLIYFRGDECKASKWINDTARLGKIMRTIDCEYGETQIGRVLDHARKEDRQCRISALVFVGDAMEEKPGELYDKAHSLRRPVFIFQEGDDAKAEKTFREIARITKGAYAKFEPGAADRLRDLLRAVAAYAAGGTAALDAKAALLLGFKK